MDTSNLRNDELSTLRVFERTEADLDHVNFDYEVYRERLFQYFNIKHTMENYSVFTKLVIPIISAALEGGYDIEGIIRLEDRRYDHD